MTAIYGATPFDRLRDRYESTRKRCSACGYEADDPSWSCRTDGQRIVYRFVCSSCAAVHEHTFQRKRA